jgi:NTE family protein
LPRPTGGYDDHMVVIRSPRVGLVLGAGGTVGGAYHAGVLTALEYDLGWDARDAAVVVGTSAGSVVGALLRRDVPPDDLAAWTVDATLSPAGALLAQHATRPEFEPLTLRQFLRAPRVPNVAAFLATLRRPLHFDPLRALLTHLHDGTQPLAPHLEFLGDGWPAAPLYECAVRQSDGRRVVFGRAGAPHVSLPQAVAASCAVPGYFAPLEHDGVRYIDGGVASTTNADVLHDLDLDLVIVVAPMSARSLRLARPDLPMRVRARGRLDEELRRLPASVPVVRFEPGRSVLAHIGLDFMAEDARREIVAAAFIDAGAQVHRNGEVLQAIGRRRVVA